MSFSASMVLATASRVEATVSLVAWVSHRLLARTTTSVPPKRLATMSAAPFASLSNTL